MELRGAYEPDERRLIWIPLVSALQLVSRFLNFSRLAGKRAGKDRSPIGRMNWESANS